MNNKIININSVDADKFVKRTLKEAAEKNSKRTIMISIKNGHLSQEALDWLDKKGWDISCKEIKGGSSGNKMMASIYAFKRADVNAIK